MKENINALRQKKIDATGRANAILVAATKGLNDEQRTQLAAIKNELAQIEADIQLTEAFLQAELTPGATLAAHEPTTDNKNKKVYAKLSDQLLANGFKPTQKSDSLAPFASLAEQLRAVFNAGRSNGMQVDPRLAEIQAALGGNESVPAEGGFLVVPEYAQGLVQRTYDVALIASKCFKMPMTSSRLIMHAVDEDSRKDGSRWGGILAYWLAEAGTYQPTKPKFREMQFVANKLIGLSYATEEQLADGPAWQAYVNEAVPQELAFQIDTAVYSGPGAGAPLGIQNSGAVLVVPKVAGQATATIVTANILQMWSQMWARSRANAVWFVNQDIEPQLYTLAFANPSGSVLYTNPMYTPPGINGNNGPYGLLFGKPVIPIEQASTLGTQGDITLADMTQYILAQRSDVRADTSIHVAFLTGEQAFRFMLRLDGQPTWKKPLTPYQGSALKSPFVTLASRP
jgi:HK97 family phage major capsid protein